MELEKETFASLKELAEIQQAIARGRAEVQNLKTTTEEYVQTREKEALQRVAQVLQASKDALSEADKNRTTLASFLASASEMVKDLEKLHGAVKSEFAEFDKSTAEVIQVIDQRTEELETETRRLKNWAIQLESEKSGLETEKRKLEKEKILLVDRQGVVQRQIERLKKGKI